MRNIAGTMIPGPGTCRARLRLERLEGPKAEVEGVVPPLMLELVLLQNVLTCFRVANQRGKKHV